MDLINWEVSMGQSSQHKGYATGDFCMGLVEVCKKLRRRPRNHMYRLLDKVRIGLGFVAPEGSCGILGSNASVERDT